MVIFDDTFSALDNKTEQKVLNNIKELVKDKTCIIISNRISDIKDANNIMVLESGEALEMGTHEELLRKKGRYYRYYKEQTTKADLAL